MKQKLKIIINIKYLYVFSLLLVSEFSFGQFSTTVPSNNNAVGIDHNLLFNADKRYNVTVNGNYFSNVNRLFDGSFSSNYSSPVNGNKVEILIENLPQIHTQIASWFGWSTRYYAPRDFKIEVFDAYNNQNEWKTVVDVQNYNSNSYLIQSPIKGAFTKIRFTFSNPNSANNQLGISELLFIHPEATTPYAGLFSPNYLDNKWESNGNHINYQKGNIGIGVSNPQNKLDVNGTVHAKEVKVDMNGWADYVFKEEYNLPTLQEVENHIKEKGHLPNIPSEKEVIDTGISVGETQKLLLQKIEELTLYIIEQNKENKAQSQKIEELTNEIKSLKQK